MTFMLKRKPSSPFKIEVEEAKSALASMTIRLWTILKPTLVTMNTKNGRSSFDKLFGEKIPSKTNATKSVRKVKFAVIRKWFVEKREGEEAEKVKKARSRREESQTNKQKATDEDKAVEQNVPLEVANNSQQEQLDLVS